MSYQLLKNLYYQDEDKYKELLSQRLNSEATEHLNIKINDYEAFYCVTQEILDLCLKIMSSDKKINQLCHMLPNVALNQFQNKCLVDEIILTNDIEGVYSTRKEIGLILNDAKSKNKRKRFFGLVQKYKMLNEDKISLQTCQDIRNIYNELVLQEVVDDEPENAPDGIIFRKDLAEVTTSTQKSIHRGVYPEEKIINYMEQALKILNNSDITILIRISIFHYLFGYIHPFYDGNGRTSRFISSYLLAKNFENLIGYRLSYTIKENISEYYEAFKICNDPKNCGDITPFIITFLSIINKSYEKLYEALISRYNDLTNYEQKIDSLELSKIDKNLCFILVQATLFSKDGISKNELCDVLKLSPAAIDNRLKKIYKVGYLLDKRISKKKYYKFDITKFI